MQNEHVKRLGCYEYWQTNNQWYFHKKGGNGEITVTGGEGFSTKGNCVAAIGRDMNDSSDFEMKEIVREVEPGTTFSA